MKHFVWENQWILDNLGNFNTWSKMCKEYNRVFKTEFTREQFKWHTNMSMGLRLSDYRYSADQDVWLKDNYSKYIYEDLVNKFNEAFNLSRTKGALKERIRALGLSLDDNEKLKRAKAGQEHAVSLKRLPAGSIGRPSNGYLLIKTVDGSWEYLSKHILRSKGMSIDHNSQAIFLDGNKTNYDPSNLDVIPIRYAPIMLKNKFYSEHPEITKTGIKWCQLYELLQKEGDIYIGTD